MFFYTINERYGGNKLMNLVDEKVLHGTFGEGNIISCSDDYIKIDFDSGVKKFVFPDVFGQFLTLTDKKAFNFVKEKIDKIEAIEKEKALRLRQEKAIADEYQRVQEEKKSIKKVKIHPELQSVFWSKDLEEETIFTDWKVFAGIIKNGEKKGEPRRLARMDGKSACLITKREADMPEKKRRILGVFMATEDFNGVGEDGYIPAHPDYRLKLSAEESHKMLFWNYYINTKFPKRKTWNSGRQRYFDNIWMAQILKDIVELRDEPEEQAYAQGFLDYFCKINRINLEELPEASGALMQ